MPKSVAFIGLGNMGFPMCKNLLQGGFLVSGLDLSPAACERFRSLGGVPFETIADAVHTADYVITMLPTGKHVRQVYEGPEGVLKHARKGTVLIDCSTIDIESSRTVNTAAAGAGFDMVDAPVSGAVPAAIEGRLTFMVGGTDTAYALALPPLQAMGKNFFHVGAAGCGQAVKICNNMMSGMSMVAISEVFTLAERLGLDYQTVFDVVTKSSGNCWALQQYCPVPGPVPTSPANNEYAPGFSVAMMLKDMRLSQQAAEQVKASTPLAGAAAAIYQMVASSGYSDLDFSVVFKLLSGRLLESDTASQVDRVASQERIAS
ncbi:3-hydroxyisobutyrate dehydrogenase [Tardiphaga sp. 367_B4_N1_1]|uniref:3-hydroxyisobutyrate dehydrogenase n=1 Tax=Tardiphaga sp. 367_B4_N1_1 TaxID=3240777 RepID=UPI003F1F13F5